MELMIITLLLIIAIIALRLSSEISHIKFQNESIRQDIRELREALGKSSASRTESPAEPEITEIEAEEAPDETEFEIRTVSGTENLTETESPSESEREAAYIRPPEVPDSMYVPTEDHQEKSQRRHNWEKFIGVNLFSKIGILVLIAGIGFFVKYAIDRDWINEVMRTVIGMCVGFSLWGIAYRIREEYRNFSSILAGGGFAICFLCIAIASNIYGILPVTATFISLIALTASMTAISLRFDRLELAIVSVAGGFIVPFIASDGTGSFMFVLGYMAILNTAMFAVTLYKNWWTLPVLSCFLTYAICIWGWVCGGLRDDGGLKFITITYYFILFSIPLVTVLRRNPVQSKIIAWLVSAMAFNSLSYLTLGWILADQSFPPIFNGLPGFIGSTVNLGIYLRYYMRRERGIAVNLLLTLIAGFALATFLLQFTNPGIHIAAAGIEAIILSWLYFRSGKRVFKTLALLIGIPFTWLTIPYGVFSHEFRAAWGCIVSGIAFIWGAYIAFTSPKRGRESILSTGALWSGGALAIIGGNTLFRHYLNASATDGCTLLLTAAMMIGVLIACRPYRLKSTYIVFPGLAVLMLAMMGNPEEGKVIVNIPLVLSWAVFAGMDLRCATDVFSHDAVTFDSRARGCYIVYFNMAVAAFAVATVIQMLDISGLQHLNSAGISVALTGCAAVEMILGMRHHNKLLRILSLCVFGIVIGKLMTYDLWRMAAVGRIVVFILLGVILLSVSFLYQRLRGVVLDDDKADCKEGD